MGQDITLRVDDVVVVVRIVDIKVAAVVVVVIVVVVERVMLLIVVVVVVVIVDAVVEVSVVIICSNWKGRRSNHQIQIEEKGERDGMGLVNVILLHLLVFIFRR